MKPVFINGREISRQQPPYVIAELSANHNGVLQKALDTISAAKASGADAIKLQTYTADTMTINSELDDFLIKGGIWDGYKLYDLYKTAQTPFEWHKEMFDHSRKIGVTCFSTPFDETAVDLLEDMNVPAYKIASFELVDLPLIRYVATTKKPMIMSTGMANLQEIEEAVEVAKEAGCEQLVVLHCISSYPAPIEQSNLLTLQDMQQRLNVQVGLSDHTVTNTASIAAVTLGASVIEKHFIIDRSDKGPDSTFSIEPDELETLCTETKNAWLSLGQAGYERKPSEKANLVFRRSIYFVKEMRKGEKITDQHIRRIRPGYGMAPKYFDYLIGKTVNQDIEAGMAVKRDLINE